MPARKRSRWLAGGAALAALFVGLVVLAVAHSGSQQSAAPASAKAPTSADQVAPVALRSIDGTPVRLPAARPGALFFTVSSCTSCLASAEALGKAKEQLGSKIDAVYISIDPNDPPSALRAVRTSVGNPPYPFTVDSSGTLYRQYHVSALGTAIVYDAHGRIVARLIEPDLGQWEAAFRQAGAA